MYEYSRFYYVGSDNIERHKDTTTLNNKSDEFYHSVYLTSSFFDAIGETELPDVEDDTGQLSLFSRRDPVYKQLQRRVDLFLRDKRKPFLKKYTDSLVERYQKEGVFPEFKSRFEIPRRLELEQLVRDLYVVKPSLFTSLNLEQRMTFVRLLNIGLDDTERDSLFDIIREVVDLDSSERDDFANLLKRTRVSNIINVAKLLSVRSDVVNKLKAMVSLPELGAKEKHLQKIVEENYWLFGEEYHLVSADQSFETALRNFLRLAGRDEKNAHFEHDSKRKRMDIFTVRRLKGRDTIDNIAVELKHPRVTLGTQELQQVKEYDDLIRSNAEFNAEKMRWRFYLVGNHYDDDIERELRNAKNHGEDALVFNPDANKFRIYVKKWSDIFTEFELSHNFILEKLQLQDPPDATEGSDSDDNAHDL